MDLLMDWEQGDLLFVNGKCPVTEAKADVLAQRIYIRLRTFLGEWFLDTTYGVPYFERIFKKNIKKSTIDFIFQEQILRESGVKTISYFESELDSSRVYRLAFSVQADDGSTSSVIIIG